MLMRACLKMPSEPRRAGRCGGKYAIMRAVLPPLRSGFAGGRHCGRIIGYPPDAGFLRKGGKNA
ncbi:hypothetical protein B2G52_02190 [Neisseria lactamica]|uniref:Uncharacterized protein n=1 Tax=Neisseria lactamica TaxID=486 RepID=A0AAU8VE47_NEILA|nr:hypothetical protein B2G52_02190 [Neisseria lactamica]